MSRIVIQTIDLLHTTINDSVLNFLFYLFDIWLESCLFGRVFSVFFSFFLSF